MREHLPDERQGLIHRFRILTARPARQGEPDAIVEVKGYVQTGLFEDGRVGEVFLKMGKPGGAHASFDAWAIAVSVALQHGADFDSFMQKFVGFYFEPFGRTDDPSINNGKCTSPIDYAARWLLKRYGKQAQGTAIDVPTEGGGL